jgi:HAD superfamily hydrolase (TIGR01549 family)
MIKAVFFDFDGVIVESVDIKTRAFGKLFEAEGDDIASRVVEYHLKNTGVSRLDKFRYIYKEMLKRPLGEEEFKSLCDRFAAMVTDLVIEAPYVEGAKEFLEKNASAYSCYVVSATPQDEIEVIIKRKGIAGLFRAIYGAPIKKEDAVRQILKKDNIDPVSAVYVGDAMSDYAAANNNSVSFIARICDKMAIFDNVDCVKVKDLKCLDAVIKAIP